MRSDQDRERMALEAFRRVGVALSAETRLEEIARVVLMEIRQAVDAQVSLFSSSAGGEVIEMPANSAAQLLPLLQSDAAKSQIFDAEDAVGALRSYMQVPLQSGSGSQLGVLCFGHPEAGQFSAHSIALVESLVPWIGAALERASSTASASSSALGDGEWVGRVSHDLRNPLQRICMVGEILSDSLEGPQRELIAKLNRASDSMEKLIADFVDVVALENKNLHLEPLAMNLSHSVLASCEASQERARAASVELVCTEGEKFPAMAMDTRRIEQALSRFIGQSIEAAPSGTQVRVDCKVEQDAICIEIRDQRTISEAELANATARMYPGSHSGAQKADLGLNIARGIVEAHGGQVRTALDPAGGMVLVLAWPLPAASAGQSD